MFETFSQTNFHALCDRVAARDADLRAILRARGYPPMWTRKNSFETLVHVILEQQISLAAALAAMTKLRALTIDVTPENILKLTDDALRACYFSRQKVIYVRHLAQAIQAGTLDLKKLKKLSDDEVRAQLIAIKGIGHWTIDIYLIFVLHRVDVFPLGDLAAVKIMRRLKNIPPDAPRDTLQAVSATWTPYRTLATMILWHEYLSAPRTRKL